jgi:tRNA dimethylallyltransferase
MLINIDKIPRDKPVLIAGPTASGKSSLALAIAEHGGGAIINADALQVFACWRSLSARPDASEVARAPHHLYGHVPYTTRYSTGHWLRDIAPLLTGPRPIIVGGTGLNFTSLTEGLAEIPEIPSDIKDQANDLNLETMLTALDQRTTDTMDTANRARVQRAYEVLKTTGRSIRDWQDETPAPLLPLDQTYPIVLTAEKDWLNERMERRFDQMLEQGAMDEARDLLPIWDADLPASRAIGGPELIAYLRGEISLEEAKIRANIATRRYAKRQRSWFRARMKDWQQVPAESLKTLTS